jgi:hypothetical protein
MHAGAMSEAKFLKLWEYVISSISAFARDESGRTEAAFEHHEGKLMPEVIFKLPPGTAKAWHKLVLRLQVCSYAQDRLVGPLHMWQSNTVMVL